MTPRGIRNNNPGNIRWGADWQGLVPQGERTDDSFCQFTAPEWGIRALAKILQTYQSKYGLNTVAKIIGRWAPPNENNTPAYIAAVASSMGVGKDDVIDVTTYETAKGIIKGIIRHENGQMPYLPQQINKGLELAGVVA